MAQKKYIKLAKSRLGTKNNSLDYLVRCNENGFKMTDDHITNWYYDTIVGFTIECFLNIRVGITGNKLLDEHSDIKQTDETMEKIEH